MGSSVKHELSLQDNWTDRQMDGQEESYILPKPLFAGT